jgi:hypothetical protein
MSDDRAAAAEDARASSSSLDRGGTFSSVDYPPAPLFATTRRFPSSSSAMNDRAYSSAYFPSSSSSLTASDAAPRPRRAAATEAEEKDPNAIDIEALKRSVMWPEKRARALGIITDPIVSASTAPGSFRFPSSRRSLWDATAIGDAVHVSSHQHAPEIRVSGAITAALARAATKARSRAEDARFQIIESRDDARRYAGDDAGASDVKGVEVVRVRGNVKVRDVTTLDAADDRAGVTDTIMTLRDVAANGDASDGAADDAGCVVVDARALEDVAGETEDATRERLKATTLAWERDADAVAKDFVRRCSRRVTLRRVLSHAGSRATAFAR